ncbi:MAG TPA: DNA polymerase III subunit beta [Dehalococcoidia bacterium]|nr:DNA polymerase III subunit beta [Dehalococcoidia bacterium]
MKLSCLQENLSKGLGIVGRAVATKTTLPITQNVLLKTDESRLKLSATNLEMAISCWVGAKIDDEGAITIPARLLTDFTNSLPNELITMKLSRNALDLTCNSFKANVKGLSADDFPPIPDVADGIVTRIEAEVLREAIAKTGFAAATDESRPVLTGVNLEFEGNKLVLASADGFRLSIYEASALDAVSSKISVIVKARTLNELGRFLADEEEPVEIVVNQQKSQVMFKLKNIVMVSQTIQGAFPNYGQLIPKSYDTRVVIDREQFLRATKMASIFSRDGGGIVRLMLTPGEEGKPGTIIVSAKADEIGDNEGTISALIDGAASKIAFNAKYLAEVLNVMGPQNQIALEISNPSSPGVIRPAGADMKFTHVVMPMFVQW